MDLSQLANLGEFIGGIAVIASLIYVGIQVRQSTEQARQSNAIERARATREVTRDVNDIFMGMKEPEMIALLRTSLSDFERLSPDDRGVLTYRYLAPMLLHSVATYLAAKDGLVENQYAERWTLAMASLAKCGGLRGWWAQMKVLLHPEFAAEVELLIESPTGPPSFDVLFPWLASGEPVAEA